MDIYSILNHKGGVGKSTISTNLAGYFANKGEKVLLGDFDVQQSSQNWLSIRNPNLKKIHTWEITSNNKLTTPSKDITKIIIDSPAGIRAQSLQKLVGMSDKIIIPLKPGMFDIMSTEFFLEELIEIINSQTRTTEVCIIGNMVDLQTKATQQLLKFIEGSGIESPTSIKQSQIYVHLAAYGLTLFDSQSNLFEKHIQDWEPLLKWVEKTDPKKNVELKATEQIVKKEEVKVENQKLDKFQDDSTETTPFPTLDSIDKIEENNLANKTIVKSQFDYSPTQSTPVYIGDSNINSDENFIKDSESVPSKSDIRTDSTSRQIPLVRPSWFMDTVREDI